MSDFDGIGVYRPNRPAVVLWPSGQELTEKDLRNLKGGPQYRVDPVYRAGVDRLHELAEYGRQMERNRALVERKRGQS